MIAFAILVKRPIIFRIIAEEVRLIVVNYKTGHHPVNNESVYIMRRGRVDPNPLSNPYQIGVDGTRHDVIQKFAYDFRVKWKLSPSFRDAILSCRRKTLICCCKPLDCHGDVILDFVNAYYGNNKSVEKAFDAIQKYIYGEFGEKMNLTNVNSDYVQSLRHSP